MLIKHEEIVAIMSCFAWETGNIYKRSKVELALKEWLTWSMLGREEQKEKSESKGEKKWT